MIYVLDTDILSLLGHRDSPEAPRIRRRIVELGIEHSIATTIINYEEQMRGWMGLLSRARTSKSEIQVYGRLLEHLFTFRRMIVLGYDTAAANLVESFRKQRLRIGTMDMKIASIVVTSDATLITHNTADFRKVPELRIEDWSL